MSGASQGLAQLHRGCSEDWFRAAQFCERAAGQSVPALGEPLTDQLEEARFLHGRGREGGWRCHAPHVHGLRTLKAHALDSPSPQRGL